MRSRSKLLLLIVLLCTLFWLFSGGSDGDADSTESTTRVAPPSKNAAVGGKKDSQPLPVIVPTAKDDVPKATETVAAAVTTAPKKTKNGKGAKKGDGGKMSSRVRPGAEGSDPNIPYGYAVDDKGKIVPTATLPFFGPVPTALSAEARDRALQMGNAALRAEAEAKEAVAQAAAAKAMVWISAETSLKSVLKRYWKAAKMQYNASVQLAAADRIRDFVMPTKPPAKTPLCIVAFHQGNGDAFPKHAATFLDSVAQNNPYANVHLFVHNVAAETFPSYPNSENVRVLDLEMIDPSYRYRGFAGFVTDGLCSAFGKGKPRDMALGWAGQDAECALLEERLAAFEGKGGHFMEQLRGHYPNIFSAWINPNMCDSWAWTSPDTVIANASRWLDSHAVRDADIVTTIDGDAWRTYLRNAFTIHNWKRNPELIAGLWKRCESFSSLTNTLKTFERAGDWLSLTEGCYSYGALTAPGTKSLLVPWQLPKWRNPTLALLYKGHLTYCTGEKNAEVCRKWVKGVVRERQAKEANEEAAWARAVAAGQVDPSDTLGRSIASTFSRPAGRVIPMSIRTDVHCSHWLPKEQQICVGDSSSDLPKMDWQNKAYIQKVTTSADGTVVVQLEEFELPDDFVATGIERGVAEVLVVPSFLEWAAVRKSDKEPPKQPKVEKTWWYDPNKGSIQITPGKILFHTLDDVMAQPLTETLAPV
ncbi:hypothetical protein HK104_009412 [Borealophlyctis nickersoniae]|nr:hypothetical protein HK104_009412 [Borealophlyctis nickersoniae]